MIQNQNLIMREIKIIEEQIFNYLVNEITEKNKQGEVT